MKRIVIDADDRIIEALGDLCAALVFDSVPGNGDLSKRYDAFGAVDELFDGNEREVAWKVID